ncbi:ATP-binding cassette sub-family F member 1, putative [Eimeria brunetti]|uniref:ATP-binding cassette sub-family F member 1, putative n=1 Tax=Eimeria brunetti TaxID=51314 RepID=U6LQ58_9EIME|nr:ATP-binding cassette sub-family F member 1, putative [Eimeria brunetti]
MRGASEDAIRSALHEITEGKLDQTTEEYLVGMLKEETPNNAEEAHELIGAFIIDAGLAADDAESVVGGRICAAVIHTLQPLKQQQLQQLQQVQQQQLQLLQDEQQQQRCLQHLGDDQQQQQEQQQQQMSSSSTPSKLLGKFQAEPTAAAAETEAEPPKAAETRAPVRLQDLLRKRTEGDFSDPYLGIQQNAAMVNYNAPVIDGDSAAAEAAKQQQLQQQRRQQQREKQLRLLQEWEKNKPPIPPPQKRHGDKQLKRSGINPEAEGIIVDSFSISVAGRQLLVDTSLKLMKGRRYGLIGR